MGSVWNRLLAFKGGFFSSLRPNATIIYKMDNRHSSLEGYTRQTISKTMENKDGYCWRKPGTGFYFVFNAVTAPT